MARTLISIALILVFTVELIHAEGEGYGITDGGNKGDTVVVNNVSDFEKYAQSGSPYFIIISGVIDVGVEINVTSNKTICGLNKNSSIRGAIKIDDSENIIIKNLKISNSHPDGDGIALRRSNNVFITHCSLYDCTDGLIDITKASDSVTISYCKFYYKTVSKHKFPNLIGASDDDIEDRGKLHVSFHHNWWAEGCHSRMPNVRFGRVHMYNNYFSCTANNYCTRAWKEAQILSEYNYYENANDPFVVEEGGIAKSVGNIYKNCTNLIYPGKDSVFTPDYIYSTTTAEIAKKEALLYAGNTNIGMKFCGEISRVSSTNEPILFEKDMPIEQLQYTWLDADSVDYYGLPPGIEASFDPSSKLISFEGAPTDTGTYVLTLSTIGCLNKTTLSDTLKVYFNESLTNVDEVNSDNALCLVYPNPANNTLYLNLESIRVFPADFVIVDLAGRVLIRGRHQHCKQFNSISFDISTLQPGIYMLNIESEEIHKTVKFVKE